MNLVDVVIIVYVAIYTFFTFSKGFIRLSLELIGLVLSLVASLMFYSYVGTLIGSWTHLPHTFANAISFIVLLFVAQFAIYTLLRVFAHLIPAPLRSSALNRWAGIAPALLSSALYAAILLTIASGLPLPKNVHAQLTDSSIGGPMIQTISRYEERIFGGAINDTLNLLTVEPKSNESVNLGFTTTKVSVDTTSEQKLVELLNHERTSRGLKALAMDKGKLRDVARAHGVDMFQRGYFAHESPDGLSPFDRLDKAGVHFSAAGENLALAPDVEIAHRGLMNSPAHKANILDPDFRRVGVGVINGGIYGEMFVQEFTD